MTWSKELRALGLLGLCAWLSACDGRQPVLSVTEERLSAVAYVGDGAPTLGVRATVANLRESLYAGVAYSTEGLSEVTYALREDSIPIGITFKDPSNLKPGIYEDKIAIAVCHDADCQHHIEGSPWIVQVTYTVRQHLDVAPETSSNLTYFIGQPQQPSALLRLGGTDVAWTATADRPWIQLGATQGRAPNYLSVTFDTAALSPGNYSGNVVITETVSNKVYTVPYALTVALPILQTYPASLHFDGSASARLDLSLTTDSEAYPWTATVSTENGAPWLQLSQTSGSISSAWLQLAVSVEPSGLEAGTYAGSITFSSTINGYPVSQVVPVTLAVASN